MYFHDKFQESWCYNDDDYDEDDDEDDVLLC